MSFAQPTKTDHWITLGTAGGPAITAERSQPANLLIADKRTFLVDAGDGAAERIGQAGYNPNAIVAVFISHLHIDHVGGLQGLIGTRWFMSAPQPLTIYGPPGTDEMVAGILRSLEVQERIGYGFGGRIWPVVRTVKVVIVKGGDVLTLGGLRVRAVENSHFYGADGKPEANGSQSLSYRFDAGDFSIAYTGDTGPSNAVADLANKVDLLVSEVIDLEPLAAVIDGPTSAIPPAARQALISHLRDQHLSPEQVGELAQKSGARRVVLTHLSMLGKTSARASLLIAGVRKTYPGKVTVARDLDQF